MSEFNLTKKKLLRESSKTRILILIFLALFSSLTFVAPRTVHAAPSPANVIRNSSFEGGLYIENVSGVLTPVPVNWSFETCEGVPNASAVLDQNQWTDKLNSTRVSTGPLSPVGCYAGTGCSPSNCPNRAVGFSQFRQGMPGLGYNITQLADDPAGLSFWFQLQPYDINNGMAAFEVRVFGAESLSELDYVFNADPSVGQYQNSTNTHSLIFNGYQFGQWYHFTRNLRADWLTPMGPANTPLNLNYNFTLIQFQGFATKSGSIYRSETFWLDDVRVYVGPGTVPPETHYTSLSLTDANNDPADNLVQWTLNDATGTILPYTLGQATLAPGPYYVHVYYPSTSANNLILNQQVHLDQSNILPLPLYPSTIVPSGHVALSAPAARVIITSPDTSRSQINIQGSAGAGYKVFVDVPSKPVLIQANGQSMTEGNDWTFDQTLSITKISFTILAGGENITILYRSSTLIPTLSFVDLTGLPVQVNFSILDSQGNRVPYVPGAVLPPRNNYLEVYYAGSRIYRSNVATIGNPKITLQMTPLDGSKTNYLALNSTASSITPYEYSSSQVKFSLTGTGPYLVIVNVEKRPVYVEVNGVRVPDWVYNNTTRTVMIPSSSDGTFLIVLDQPPLGLEYLLTAIVAVAAVVFLVILYWRRSRVKLAPFTSGAR